MDRQVKKAVIPAAGMGRRLLPATLVVPKELLPVGREPMLWRALKEAAEAGLDEIAVVVRHGDTLVKEFLFDAPLRELGEEKIVEEMRALLSSLDITLIVQPEPRGLGDALGQARWFVGEEPFAVALPDNLFFGSPGALSQLVPVFEKHGKNLTGLIRITPEEAPTFGNCGSVELDAVGHGEYRVIEVGEKRAGYFSFGKGGDGIRWFARHVFQPSFFEYLDRFGVERDGEVDDVPVLEAMAANGEIMGKLLDGKGFDVGNERGLAAAQRFLWGEVSAGWS